EHFLLACEARYGKDDRHGKDTDGSTGPTLVRGKAIALAEAAGSGVLPLHTAPQYYDVAERDRDSLTEWLAFRHCVNALRYAHGHHATLPTMQDLGLLSTLPSRHRYTFPRKLFKWGR